MSLDLFKISVESDQAIIRLAEIGAEFATELEAINAKALNKVGIAALAAFRSAVPVDTEQLRNSQIQIDFSKKNQKQLTAKVYVVDSPHGRNGISASNLATKLDKGIGKTKTGLQFLYRRTQDSKPVDPYSFSLAAKSRTAGWIEKGYAEFLTQLNRVDI